MNFPGQDTWQGEQLDVEPDCEAVGAQKSSQPQAGRGAGDTGPEMGRLELWTK